MWNTQHLWESLISGGDDLICRWQWKMGVMIFSVEPSFSLWNYCRYSITSSLQILIECQWCLVYVSFVQLLFMFLFFEFSLHWHMSWEYVGVPWKCEPSIHQQLSFYWPRQSLSMLCITEIVCFSKCCSFPGLCLALYLSLYKVLPCKYDGVCCLQSNFLLKLPSLQCSCGLDWRILITLINLHAV